MCSLSPSHYTNIAYWVTLTLYCTGKFGISAAFVAIQQIATEIYPTVVRGRGIGLSSTFGMLAPALVPIVNYTVITFITQTLCANSTGILSSHFTNYVHFLSTQPIVCTLEIRLTSFRPKYHVHRLTHFPFYFPLLSHFPFSMLLTLSQR